MTRNPTATGATGATSLAAASDVGLTCDDVDEVLDLSGDGGLARLETRGQAGNTAHHCVVTGQYADPCGGAWSANVSID